MKGIGPIIFGVNTPKKRQILSETEQNYPLFLPNNYVHKVNFTLDIFKAFLATNFNYPLCINQISPLNKN